MLYKKETMPAQACEWVALHGLAHHPKSKTCQGASWGAFGKAFGTCRDRVKYWCEHYPEFEEAVEKGLAIFDEGIEDAIVRSLMESAQKGTDTHKKKVDEYAFKDGEPILVKRVIQEEEKPRPICVASATFLLSNINGDKWVNRYSQKTEGNVKVEMKNYDMSQFSDAELAEITDKILDGKGEV